MEMISWKVSSFHKLSKAYAPATEVEKDLSAQTKLSVTSDPIASKKKPINDVEGDTSKLKATSTILIENIYWDLALIKLRWTL